VPNKVGLSRKKSPGDELARENRRRIRRAALAVFSRKGYVGASIPEIARKAGVSVGTIYNYYKNKEDLLLAVITYYLPSPGFIKYLQNPPEADGSAFFKKLLDELLILTDEHSRSAVFLLDEVQRDEKFRQKYLETVTRPFRHYLDGYFTSGIAAGSFSSSNPSIATTFVSALIIGLTLMNSLERGEGTLKITNRQELLSELTELILYGLKGNKPARQCQ
jgi:AcrR family transcriptional regulator